MGQYGSMLANGQCNVRPHYCAATVASTGATRGGAHANDYLDPNNPNNIWSNGYVEVTSGSPLPDDVVIWQWIPGSYGRTYGHIGFVVIGPNGPCYISNYNGTIQVRRFEGGSGPRFFRRVRGGGTRPAAARRSQRPAPLPDPSGAPTVQQTATAPRQTPAVSRPVTGPGIDPYTGQPWGGQQHNMGDPRLTIRGGLIEY